MSDTRGLVLRARSGFYTVATDDGDLVEARLRGRVNKERQASDLAVIGDRVSLQRLPDGSGAIDAVEPRERRFSRRQPGPRGSWREDVMVANPDMVAVVFACDRPPPNPRLIDRFLVMAEYNEVPVLLLANKVDLVGDGRAVKSLVEERSLWAGISSQGVNVCAGWPWGSASSALCRYLRPRLRPDVAAEQLPEFGEQVRFLAKMAEVVARDA